MHLNGAACTVREAGMENKRSLIVCLPIHKIHVHTCTCTCINYIYMYMYMYVYVAVHLYVPTYMYKYFSWSKVTTLLSCVCVQVPPVLQLGEQQSTPTTPPPPPLRAGASSANSLSIDCQQCTSAQLHSRSCV